MIFPVRAIFLFVALLIALTLANLCTMKIVRASTHQLLWVRVTHYNLQGYMYNGQWVYAGAAACSENLALGTHILFEDGREVV